MPLQRDDVSSWGARFSPDVRAVAFVSDKSGRDEVYVGRFPAEGDAHLVSSNGGREPAWRRDGRELFYLAEDGTLMSVEVSPRAGGSMFGKPTALFRTRSKSASLRNTYDVSPDGQTFLVNQALEDDARIPITVELNWTTRLRR
jgi:hypothetical protein